jgi:hypothetical protein
MQLSVLKAVKVHKVHCQAYKVEAVTHGTSSKPSKVDAFATENSHLR